MQIANSLYHKVWEVKLENGFKKVTLGDSRKNKDGEFENWNWFDVALVSKAKDVHIEKGDTITIISGQVQKRKYNDKFYDNVVIFDLEVSKKGSGGYGSNQQPNSNNSSNNQQPKQNYTAPNDQNGNFEDDIPF